MSITDEIKTFLTKIAPYQKALFLIFTLIAGLLVLSPLWDFQTFIASGDHGRDLYCFKKTMEGAVPYQDYSWLFGPLMPYYYSIFDRLLGVSIQSVVFGQNLLILAVGILIYLCSAVFLSPVMSFIAAVTYWSFRGIEFFYTYNHIGGLVGILGVIYFLFRYIKNPRFSYVLAGFGIVLFPLLIRLNIGISTLVAFVISLGIVDHVKKNPLAFKRRKQYLLLTLCVSLITFAIYWFLLHPLPPYAIQQSLPYSTAQRTDVSNNIFVTGKSFIAVFMANFTSTWSSRIFGLILLVCMAQSLAVLIRGKWPKEKRTNIFLALAALFLFLILNLHEFLASGVYYRYIWIIPVEIMALFFFLFIGTQDMHSRLIKVLLPIALLLGPTLKIMNYNNITNLLKTPQTLFEVGENRIYALQQESWIETVKETTRYIQNHVPPGGRIIAIPFDPLYFFLSNRDNATREFMFFAHRNITQEQEEKVIDDMERYNVNYVIISNRSVSPDPGLGVFGKDYCPLLAKYIFDHYEVVEEFGRWDALPAWNLNHAVRIYKRKRSSKNF